MSIRTPLPAEVALAKRSRLSLSWRVVVGVRVVGAVVEFCFGRLIANPHRVGHPLGRELEGWHSARVGAYRVVYWIDEDERVLYIDRVDHRSDVYRPK